MCVAQRVELVVPVEVDRLLADHRERERPLDRVGRELLPLAVDPGPDLDELAEVDLRVEVGGEVAAVAAGVDVEDVDRVDRVEVLLDGERGVGIDDTGVEAGAEHGGDALLGAEVLLPPLVVGVPRRVLADLVRILVDRGVDVGRAGLDAGVEHRHVDERRAEVHHDLGAGLADQRRGGGDVEGVELQRVHLLRLVLDVALALDAVDDRLALGHRPGRDADVAEHVVVHRRFVGGHVGHAAGADDQQVLLHR